MRQKIALLSKSQRFKLSSAKSLPCPYLICVRLQRNIICRSISSGPSARRLVAPHRCREIFHRCCALHLGGLRSLSSLGMVGSSRIFICCVTGLLAIPLASCSAWACRASYRERGRRRAEHKGNKAKRLTNTRRNYPRPYIKS